MPGTVVGSTGASAVRSYDGPVEFLTSEIAGAVGGRLVGDDVTVAGVAFDSRLVDTGDLFVALTGDRDGHDFVAAAVDSGATAVLVSRLVEGVTAIVVDDPDVALGRLGALARTRLPDRVIGITGSMGKTSTKDLATAVLSNRFVVTANQRSFNNEVGVPFTLANARPDTEVTIVEMGARGDGHITDLCDIARPTIGVVTAVALAHSEFMGGPDDIARAKSELVAALPVDGLAVLNADDVRVAAMASATTARVVTFGRSESAHVRAVDVSVDDDLTTRFTLEAGGGRVDVHLAVAGEHHVSNALAAAAIGLELGVPLAEIAGGLGAASLSPWRMELGRTSTGARVLNDAYNAAPASMDAALRSLAQLPAARRCAVLGPMAELGAWSDDAHRAVTALADELGIVVIAYGTDSYGVELVVSTIDDAVAALGRLDDTDAVLVKGSRVAGLDRLAEELLD